MAHKILQINIRFTMPAEELEKEYEAAAGPISNVSGLIWKIFCFDDSRKEGAGIYLFKDEASLDGYVNGPVVARMKSLPFFSDISMKSFDIAEAATAITRGPL